MENQKAVAASDFDVAEAHLTVEQQAQVRTDLAARGVVEPVALEASALIGRLQLLAAGDAMLIKSELARSTIREAIERIAAALRDVAPVASNEMLLYEHDDGRYAVATDAESAAFTHGDPAWHRVGPVTVYGSSGVAPVSATDLIVRDVCETDPADPDEMDTICIGVDTLRLILENHIAAAPTPPASPASDAIRECSNEDCDWNGRMNMYAVYFNSLLILTVPARSRQEAIDHVAGVPVGNHPLYSAVKL